MERKEPQYKKGVPFTEIKSYLAFADGSGRALLKDGGEIKDFYNERGFKRFFSRDKK